MEPCGFVTDESKPRRIEKLHFQADSLAEKVKVVYCLLKLAILVFFRGAAEISFDQEEEIAAGSRFEARKRERQGVTRRRIERRWTSSNNQAGRG